MRCIGHLVTEEDARVFGDFLYVEGIPGHVEADAEQGWAVWVEDEDHLASAMDWLARFEDNPTDPLFRAKAKQATALREEAQRSDAAYARKLKDRREVLRPRQFAGTGVATMAIIGVCVAVAVLRMSPGGEDLTDRYLASSPSTGRTPEILHGEIWRLVTPIFIHAPLLGGFGFLHLLFNMLWLRDLGGLVENRQGTGRLLLLVLVLAVISNAFQYFVGPTLLWISSGNVPSALGQLLRMFGESLGGVSFYGMSGVNYGLLGYIWIRGRCDPGSGLFLHPQTVGFMLIWFVLCFTPILPGVANGAHMGGLLAGMLWGWLASLRYR